MGNHAYAESLDSQCTPHPTHVVTHLESGWEWAETPPFGYKIPADLAATIRRPRIRQLPKHTRVSEQILDPNRLDHPDSVPRRRASGFPVVPPVVPGPALVPARPLAAVLTQVWHQQ